MNIPTRNFLKAIGSLLLVAGVAACGGKGDPAKPASQVAAKVNKSEISVHQINNALSRYTGLPEAGIGQARAQILDKLIDQELLVQKAQEAKLDRDAGVMQAIDGMRRQMLAQAYLERAVANVPKPSAQEVRTFYAEHPQLFQERRIYRLQEVAVNADEAQARKLQGEVSRTKILSDVTGWLRTQGIKFKSAPALKTAEQLPLDVLAQFHAAKDGQIFAFPAANGTTSVVQIVDTQSAPLNEQEATPYIEQFLQNQLRMKLAEKEVKDLRAAAKVEYVGDFANRPAVFVPTAGADAVKPDAKAPERGDFVGRGLSGMK
jgi:EpsD family peptidyl-prolyl cis-trans isomerase